MHKLRAAAARGSDGSLSPGAHPPYPRPSLRLPQHGSGGPSAPFSSPQEARAGHSWAFRRSALPSARPLSAHRNRRSGSLGSRGVSPLPVHLPRGKEQTTFHRHRGPRAGHHARNRSQTSVCWKPPERQTFLSPAQPGRHTQQHRSAESLPTALLASSVWFGLGFLFLLYLRLLAPLTPSLSTRLTRLSPELRTREGHRRTVPRPVGATPAAPTSIKHKSSAGKTSSQRERELIHCCVQIHLIATIVLKSQYRRH